MKLMKMEECREARNSRDGSSSERQATIVSPGLHSRKQMHFYINITGELHVEDKSCGLF